MNDYEGLNLPQLLELMHELVVPEPVSRMLEGPGWWILAGWLVAVLGIVATALVDRRRRNRYRREAETMLKSIASNAEADPGAAAAEIAIVLKKTALAAYPREQVASLCGADWARFLSETANNDVVIAKASMQLASAAYRGDVDGRTLITPARRWVRLHRA